MFVILVVMPFLLSGVKSDIKEPQCLSNFDYEHKLLYKLITIEEEVKKFRIFIDELQKTQVKEVREQDNALETTLAKFENDAEKGMDEFKAKSDKVIMDLEDKLADLSLAAEGMRKVQVVGFSLKRPKDSPTFGQLTFANVITNVDDTFDLTTGVFTCKTPGHYYLSVSLLKNYRHKGSAYCVIRKNGTDLAYAHVQAGHSSALGYYATGNSVFVHLATGDTVTLAGCTATSTLHSHSSFSGFLVARDAV